MYPFASKEKINVTEAKKGGGVLGFLGKIGLAEPVERPIRNTPVPAAPRNTPVPQAPVDRSTPTPNPDPAVLQRLEERLQKNCPQAYTAFMEQYAAVEGVIEDEHKRFQVALKTSHTTADQIIAALDQLVAVMAKAQTDFLEDYEEKKTKKLGEAEASIKATDDLIATNEKQLQALQETIASLHTKRENDTKAMHDKAASIEDVKCRFDASLAQVLGRLQAHKSRVLSMPKV
jgi:hypothetical protein